MIHSGEENGERQSAGWNSVAVTRRCLGWGAEGLTSLELIWGDCTVVMGRGSERAHPAILGESIRQNLPEWPWKRRTHCAYQPQSSGVVPPNAEGVRYAPSNLRPKKPLRLGASMRL